MLDTAFIDHSTDSIDTANALTTEAVLASAAPWILGIDSIEPSGSPILGNAASTGYLGQMPQFWGRYFYAPGQRNAAGHVDSHYASSENAFLRANGIRVLPIARQTALVGRDAAQATLDAQNNVAALFEVFPASYLSGADPDVLMFLDIEQDTPVSADYYGAWSDTLVSEAARLSSGRVRLHPAVYCGCKDTVTWAALNAAIAAGAACDGAWIARYYYPGPQPHAWDDHLVLPAALPPCPMLAWQYWSSPDNAPESANFDASIVNTSHADMLMSRLVMPPPA